ncbi:hypothetical protein N5E66_07360 [Acinetobacter johnsonii]|uniref:Uncharacterized protein n=1 Tax=Acinetobacter colistiniresistens TaxID=280145 RepID=S3TNV0_9GAMM|nr:MULTISPECIES: hypothetical protein [Acinetobacter]EPG42623.1 hypothetical protein F907_00247 [Acinetobacter colistiniresistens]MCH7339125.1 hypothetical protein [Acinetobacter higginsii]MCJ0829323.1 hypothetical protein [Acinetobacter sp. NIPH1876]MDH1488020.1 hypothetical protein [Acinetobacter johnsonii]MDH1613952.1 hypothetical protein [Acinetobacter johnsonii]
MLADKNNYQSLTGRLSKGTHLPGEWLATLTKFIFDTLVEWRDNPLRPKESSETILSSQLCSDLNSASRHQGWDFVQFKQEEPDGVYTNRRIDLAATPCGTIIWLEGVQYNQYQTLLPIECKRLPIPTDPKRDPREYLYTNLSSTGGVQRFKTGHHGAKHIHALMIGYVQKQNILYWNKQLNEWVQQLCDESLPNWSLDDQCILTEHKMTEKVARLNSIHSRSTPLPPINITHLWVEM